MKAFVLLLGFCFFLYPDASNSWTPEFSMQVRTIGSVVPSPNAGWIAYTEAKPVAEGERSEGARRCRGAATCGKRTRPTYSLAVLIDEGCVG